MPHGWMPAIFVCCAIYLGSASPAISGLPCTAWLTRVFFEVAKAAEVSRCLAKGADPKALVGDPWDGRYWLIDRLVDSAFRMTMRDPTGDTPLHLVS